MEENLLETLEGLPENAAYDLLLYTTWPGIVHDIGSASRVH
jgi:hypothetical protein